METKEWLRNLALESGFSIAGFSRAEISIVESENILQWENRQLYGSMDWFPERNAIRLHFENLGFKPVSVISLAVLYNPRDYAEIFSRFSFKFSRYAVGRDYHNVIKQMLAPILSELRKKFPENHFRAASDSLPIAEKVLALNSGIGWRGKNTNIINSKFGSYFFLAEILTDLEIAADIPEKNRCGSCTACIDICPTQALTEAYQIDAGKCISHATIEERSDKLSIDTHGWIYGCDLCQSVCPWNIKAERNGRYSMVSEFQVSEHFVTKTEEEILSLDEKSFHEFFKESAVMRISHKQYNRNVKAFYQRKTESA